MPAIEVAYGTRQKQSVFSLHVVEGTTIQQAIELSGILQIFPGLNLQAVGIWGKKRQLNTVVSDGDRVEIYRPLIADPKLSRIKRIKAEGKN